MLEDFAVGFNLLILREHEGRVAAPVRAMLLALRRTLAASYRRKLAGQPDDGTLLVQVDAALDDPAIWAEPDADRLLHALTGLHLVLAGRDDEPLPEAEPDGP